MLRDISGAERKVVYANGETATFKRDSIKKLYFLELDH